MGALRRAVATILALAAVAAAGFAELGPRSPSSPDAARVALAFEWAINVERGHRGLPALYVDNVESAQAQTWSSLMAWSNTLAEDPHFGAAITQYDPSWQEYGENVGVGPTPQSLEGAFMASPPHRANMLGEFTHVGVGVAITTDGRIWVTERFYR
jgi:uncharacterized protein YkwD